MTGTDIPQHILDRFTDRLYYDAASVGRTAEVGRFPRSHQMTADNVWSLVKEVAWLHVDDIYSDQWRVAVAEYWEIHAEMINQTKEAEAKLPARFSSFS